MANIFYTGRLGGTHIADTLREDSFDLYGKVLLARAHKVWKKVRLSYARVVYVSKRANLQIV